MSRPTKTLTGEKARRAILEGVHAIYEPVRRTLGPQGRNALLYRTFNRGSRITNDGVTVAECQEPKDVFQRLAAAAFKEACKRTNEKVGDATTGTTVVAGKLFIDVFKMLSEGKSEFTRSDSGKVGVMTLRKQILETAELVKAAIKKSATKVETLEELEKIAIVSVEDEELGKIIAKMAWEVGIDGFIDVVEGYKGEIETEVIRGFRFPGKVGAKAFVNNPTRYEMVAQDAAVLVTNYAFDNASETAPMLQALNKTVSKLIVIAPSFSENILVQMVNATKQGFFFFPVAVPALRTEQFEDLAIYCGAQFIDKNKGKKLRMVDANDLGFLEKLIIKDTEAREDAIATGGKGALDEMMSYTDTEIVEEKGKNVKRKVLKEKVSSKVAERIAVLKGQLAETQQEQFKKLLERRIASMGSAVGVVRVGDSTQASSLYRKLKIEDAVYACKAALRGGYVHGGGLCLKEIAETLPEENVMRAALMAPYEQIQSSVDGGIEIGPEIIDPMEAIFYTVEHAAGVVAALATVDVITVEIEDPLTGEGEHAIARALTEFVVSNKRHLGQISASQEEAERDRMNGLTVEEMVSLDNG